MPTNQHEPIDFSKPPYPPDTNFILLSFEEVKRQEKWACAWLVHHKHLKETDPKRWGTALVRYRLLCKILNAKTPAF